MTHSTHNPTNPFDSPVLNGVYNAVKGAVSFGAKTTINGVKVRLKDCRSFAFQYDEFVAACTRGHVSQAAKWASALAVTVQFTALDTYCDNDRAERYVIDVLNPAVSLAEEVLWATVNADTK